MRVLIADDDSDIRVVLIRSLETLSKHAYEIEAVNNGAQAIERILQGDIDILITDLRMPEMSGAECIKRVREFSQMPIIVVSAYSDAKTMATAYEAGATRFFTKPPDFYRLASTIINLTRTKTQPSVALENHYRRLEKLKEHAALKGIDTEPAILIEIEDLENKLSGSI